MESTEQFLEMVVEKEGHLMVAYVQPPKEIQGKLEEGTPKRIPLGSISIHAWNNTELNKVFVELITSVIQLWLNERGQGELTVAIAVPPEQG